MLGLHGVGSPISQHKDGEVAGHEGHAKHPVPMGRHGCCQVQRKNVGFKDGAGRRTGNNKLT